MSSIATHGLFAATGVVAGWVCNAIARKAGHCRSAGAAAAIGDLVYAILFGTAGGAAGLAVSTLRNGSYVATVAYAAVSLVCAIVIIHADRN